MKFLIINGSPRKKGNTDKIVLVLKRAIEEKKLKAEEIILRDIEMKLCDGCENCANSLPCSNIKDEFSKKYLLKIPNYDAYIFVTPIYCDNVTALLKNFIDRSLPIIYSDKEMCFKDKKIGIIVHGMEAEKHWQIPVMWIKGICKWTEAKFIDYLILKSGAMAGDIKIDNKKVKSFLNKFL